jgi:uncharacterized membrane-anchored protein
MNNPSEPALEWLPDPVRKYLNAPTASKVPEITATFWAVKLLTTAVGEATSDSLVHQFGGPVAVPIGAVAFALAIAVQFSRRRYETWAYWIAVGMVGVFGTMAADVLHVGLGIPYLVSASFYLVVLAVVFWLWHRCEGTLSIHSITSRRRESFYWLAVLATFALGTATGDLTATTFHLGYLGSAVMFAVLFAVPGLVFWAWRRHGVLFFWVAYVLTRPFGASVADWLGFSHARGGEGVGSATVAVLGTVLFAILVAYLAFTHVDVEPEP